MTAAPESLPGTPGSRRPAVDAFDVLSDLLRVVRLTGAVLFRGDLSAPWAFETLDSTQLAAMLLPGAKRLVLFHLVSQGECFIAMPDGQWNRLEGGDIVVLPYGDVHTMASDRMQQPVSVAGLVGGTQMHAGLPIVAHGGGGERTSLICGFVHCDELLFNPLLKALPSLIHVRANAAAGRSLLATTARNLTDEAHATHAGSACVLARLTELLFIEVLRGQMATLPPQAIGWLGALNDRMVGRALQSLHAEPAHPWTVESLARCLGTSRSVLGARFKRLLGESPMRYLTRWRLQLAAQLLRDGAHSIASIATQVGYESEAAFNRAFKRQAGEPPATWRARAQQLARMQGATPEAR